VVAFVVLLLIFFVTSEQFALKEKLEREAIIKEEALKEEAYKKELIESMSVSEKKSQLS
jgi:hypothetical protein